MHVWESVRGMLGCTRFPGQGILWAVPEVPPVALELCSPPPDPSFSPGELCTTAGAKVTSQCCSLDWEMPPVPSWPGTGSAAPWAALPSRSGGIPAQEGKAAGMGWSAHTRMGWVARTWLCWGQGVRRGAGGWVLELMMLEQTQGRLPSVPRVVGSILKDISSLCLGSLLLWGLQKKRQSWEKPNSLGDGADESQDVAIPPFHAGLPERAERAEERKCLGFERLQVPPM